MTATRGARDGANSRTCVRCGVPFALVVVPCPDADGTCCALHYGERCPHCGGDVYEAPA